jgi:hypothetical protein
MSGGRGRTLMTSWDARMQGLCPRVPRSQVYRGRARWDVVESEGTSVHGGVSRISESAASAISHEEMALVHSPVAIPSSAPRPLARAGFPMPLPPLLPAPRPADTFPAATEVAA